MTKPKEKNLSDDSEIESGEINYFKKVILEIEDNTKLAGNLPNNQILRTFSLNRLLKKKKD